MVGHADRLKLGDLDARQIADVVQQLSNDGKTSVDKLTLVGCGTACVNDGPSLVGEVSSLLKQRGASTAVKGYETALKIDVHGHKQPTQTSDQSALGKNKKPPSPDATSEASSVPGKTSSDTDNSAPPTPGRSPVEEPVEDFWTRLSPDPDSRVTPRRYSSSDEDMPSQPATPALTADEYALLPPSTPGGSSVMTDFDLSWIDSPASSAYDFDALPPTPGAWVSDSEPQPPFAPVQQPVSTNGSGSLKRSLTQDSAEPPPRKNLRRRPRRPTQIL